VENRSRLEFEAVYRENVRPVTAFFARRCGDPQQVADLTSQTFVEAIRSAASFEGRGTPRAWLIAIARRVYANHIDDQSTGVDLIDQLGGRLVLAEDEVDDLAERIDAQRDGRELLERAARLSDLERGAIELVDLIGLTPKDAARVLGVSPNALRVRLFRAHARLRKELSDDRLR
jgi:RNA polymerase sigma-70 factor (ECF subfamily)